MATRAKPPTLVQVMRGIRSRNGWTLKEMSEQSGIPVSTLSKVEHDRLTLTYDLSPKIRYRLKGAGLRRSLNGAAPAEDEPQDLAQQFGIFRPQTPEVPDADQINPNQRPNNIPERVFTEGQ